MIIFFLAQWFKFSLGILKCSCLEHRKLYRNIYRTLWKLLNWTSLEFLKLNYSKKGLKNSKL